MKDNSVKTEMIKCTRFINKSQILKAHNLFVNLLFHIILRFEKNDSDFEIFAFSVFYWGIVPD
jgi:hypothetical protein